jgi:hypothetical protein
MGSCIYDKISWISHPKCQLFIGQEIYEGSFIFHVIYFNFILSFLLKNKITHGEIWLIENLCFYRCPLETSSLTFEISGHVLKNMVERVLYFQLKFDMIILDFRNKWATNTLTGLQEIFFFIGSGHRNILFWRAHCSKSNDTIRSWFQLVVNELSQIKDFDSYSLSSLDMRALIVWWIICLLHSRSNALSFIIPCILNRLRAKD